MRLLSTHLSTLQEDVATIAILLAARLVLPVINTTEQSKNSRWDTDKQIVVVRASSLEHQNTLRAISCQTLSKDTSSSTSSADNVIIRLGNSRCNGGCGVESRSVTKNKK